MIELLQALQDLEMVRAIRTSTTYYPLLNGTHILGFALLLGAIASYDLKLLGLFQGKMEGALSVARIGFAIALITGFLLFATRATHYIGNIAFAIKGGLLALGLANASAFQFVKKYGFQKVSAIISLITWIGVLYAGRWIGFT